MDKSTEGVTLFALFINDILVQYKEADPESYDELLEMADGHNLSDPFGKVPMAIYNDMCEYVEFNLGQANLKKIGETIGGSVFDALIAQNIVKQNPSPKEILEGLIVAAANMIQDPKGRGWVMESNASNAIVMKRTQTFNSILQFGLLKGLVKKTGVTLPEVKLLKSVKDGADFDEYEVSWK